MELRIRYDESFVVVDVPRDKRLYVCVGLVEDPTADPKTEEARIQDAWDVLYNRPEYNVLHRETRHLDGRARARRLDGRAGRLAPSDENGEPVSMMDYIAVTPVSTEDAALADLEYEEKCSLIRRSMKPKWADMAIAVILDGMKLPDYARSVGEKYDSVKHTFAKVKRRFVEIFS